MKRLILPILLFLVTVSGYSQLHNTSSKLKVAYSFDNVDDDSSGNGLDFKVYGTANYQTSPKISGSHSFGFNLANYIRIPIVDLGDTVGISFWFHQTSDPTTGEEIITIADNADGFRVYTGTTKRITVNTIPSSATPSYNTGPIEGNSTWIPVQLNIFPVSGRVRIWVNGSRSAQIDSSITAGFSTNDSLFLAVDYGRNGDLSANIDEFRIYDIAFQQYHIDSLNTFLYKNTPSSGVYDPPQYMPSTRFLGRSRPSNSNFGTVYMTYNSIQAAIAQGEYGYDSTYTLAVTSKYAIPEDVNNGDYVGIWRRTWTWMSGNSISYSIESDPLSAFSINASTGVISITNAAAIDGKIVQQDTLVNLIIRTTDSGIGFELDTAKIWIKEAAWCRFINPNYTGTEGTTRTQPHTDIDEYTMTVGYGYFFLRGTSHIDYGHSYTNFNASAAHPTVWGAYGSGANPNLNGNNATSFLSMGINTAATWVSHFYMYDLTIRNNLSFAVKIYRPSEYFGFYNCNFWDNNSNPNQVSTEAIIINGTTSYADSLEWRPTEIWACDFDTLAETSYYEPDYIKIAAGPLSIVNCKFQRSKGYAIRVAGTGKHNYIAHNYILDVRGAAMQLRADSTTALDNRIINSPGVFSEKGIEIRQDMNLLYYQSCDYVTVKNNYIASRSTNAALLMYAPGSTTYPLMHDIIIENNIIKGGNYGWYMFNSTGTIFRRNKISGFTNQAIYFANSINRIYNPVLTYNEIGGNINCDISSGASLYNNTIIGSVDFTGSTTATVRNCYYLNSVTNATVSNNINLISINTANEFVNYSGKDYRLVSTATGINIGYGFGSIYLPDIKGSTLNGLIEDIGANEYIP